MKYVLTCLIPTILFLGCITGLYILEIRLLLKWLRQHIGKKPTDRILTKKSAIVCHILCISGLLCLAWAYFVEPYWPEINTIPIQTDKLKKTSIRVVQISDLHCEQKIRLKRRLIEEVNRLNADLIVFTGDAVNDYRALGVFQKTLRAMHASLGKYAVRGNVDNRLPEDLPLFRNTGFVELSMETITIEKDGESFGLCGIDEKLGRSSYQALKYLKPQQFNLLLFHTTDLIDYMEPYPLDLYLCGHTHGGQVALPFYGALITQSHHGKKYEAGLYEVGSIRLYVNRGIGMTGGWAPPIRFCARPEITVFEIVPEKPVLPEQK